MDTLHWRGGITIPPIKELCESLETKFLEQEKEIERVKNENEKLKDEHFKENKIAELIEENKKLKKQLVRGFPITTDEEDRIGEFMKTHECKYRNSKLHGIDNYRFDIISGIGYNAYVKCNCGKEFCFYEE